MHLCTNTYTYICIYIETYIDIYIHIYIHIYIYMCIRVCVCMYIRSNIYIHMYHLALDFFVIGAVQSTNFVTKNVPNTLPSKIGQNRNSEHLFKDMLVNVRQHMMGNGLCR